MARGAGRRVRVLLSSRRCRWRAGADRLPCRGHPQWRAVRQHRSPARPGPSGAHAHRHPRRRRARDGAAQDRRSGLHACRRPGSERDRHRGDDHAVVRAAQQPARHRLRRPAWHGRVGAVEVQGSRAGHARRAVRGGPADAAPGAMQGDVVDAALHPRRERPGLLHDDARGAGPRCCPCRTRRRAHRSRRWLVRDAGRARVPAPVSGIDAAHRHRWRGAPRHGAAGQFLHRQPGRVRCDGRCLCRGASLRDSAPGSACALQRLAAEPAASGHHCASAFRA